MVLYKAAYLTYMQSTSWEMSGWMKHKLESTLPGEISVIRYADDTTLMAESKEELKSLWMKVKEKSEKANLKLNIQKTKIMASSPITSWHTDGETMETVIDFIFLIVLGLFSVGLFLLLCFMPREVPLAFVVKLVWYC